MIAAVLAGACVGMASALLPLINAEAYVAGLSALGQQPVVVAAGVVALTVGQTGGKVLIFTASRRGATRWRRTHTEKPSRAPK